MNEPLAIDTRMDIATPATASPEEPALSMVDADVAHALDVTIVVVAVIQPGRSRPFLAQRSYAAYH
ncbi:MAG: hypothetical protein IT427_03485, partial [Pirellulales bacterium]|nr:hypothetical protein [Pirellulales bacterium]